MKHIFLLRRGPKIRESFQDEISMLRVTLLKFISDKNI